MAASSSLLSCLQKDLEDACTAICSIVATTSSSSITHTAVALQRNRDLHSLLQRLLNLYSQLAIIDEQQALSNCTRKIKDARALARDSISSCLAQVSQAEESLALQVSAAKQNIRRRSSGSSMTSVPLKAVIALSKNCASSSCAGIRLMNHPADRQDVRHDPPFPLNQDPYFFNKYRSSLPPAHLPVLSWSLDDVLEPWQKDIIGGFLDPTVAAAESPNAEPESDDGERLDYEDYYRDMDDKFSDEEDDNNNHGTNDDAPVLKKNRGEEASPLAEDGNIVVDLEEVLSPEEFEALYAEIPSAVNGSMDNQQPGGVADDREFVDEADEAEVVKDAEELGDLNPEDLALFIGQEFPP